MESEPRKLFAELDVNKATLPFFSSLFSSSFPPLKAGSLDNVLIEHSGM